MTRFRQAWLGLVQCLGSGAVTHSAHIVRNVNEHRQYWSWPWTGTFPAIGSRMIFDPQRIPALVRRVSKRSGLELATAPHSSLARLLLRLERVATTRVPIILWGEPGVGRATLARAVHAMDVSDRPFVRVRCAFRAEADLATALFGAPGHAHPLGSGAVHAAVGGTLHLESLEDLPIRIQLRLGDMLETIANHEMGGGAAVPRVVATMTVEPSRAVEDGDLAEELFYLLGVFTAAVPPLRARRADIPLLAQHFLERANKRLGLDAAGFTEQAIAGLTRAPWHGNASELRNVVEHAALVAGSKAIGVRCLPALEPVSGRSPLSPKVVVPVGTSAAQAERELILATLEYTGFNKAEAARTLELDVKTVRSKLRSYGI